MEVFRLSEKRLLEYIKNYWTPAISLHYKTALNTRANTKNTLHHVRKYCSPRAALGAVEILRLPGRDEVVHQRHEQPLHVLLPVPPAQVDARNPPFRRLQYRSKRKQKSTASRRFELRFKGGNSVSNMLHSVLLP